MKTLAVFIFFSVTTLATFAQNTPYGTQPPPPNEMGGSDDWGFRYFHFGLNITPGIYWSNTNSSNSSANGASFGLGYGANLEFYFTRNYGIVLGIEISDISSKYTNTTALKGYYYDSIIHHNETVQYLQFPFMLKMKTVPFGNIRYYGVIGLEFGFRLKATDDYSYILNTNALPAFLASYSENNVDISSQTDFFRASIVIGGGLEYKLAGSTALQASLTYNSCFTNLNNTSSNAVNIKGVELMLGVLF